MCRLVFPSCSTVSTPRSQIAVHTLGYSTNLHVAPPCHEIFLILALIWNLRLYSGFDSLERGLAPLDRKVASW